MRIIGAAVSTLINEPSGSGVRGSGGGEGKRGAPVGETENATFEARGRDTGDTCPGRIFIFFFLIFELIRADDWTIGIVVRRRLARA